VPWCSRAARFSDTLQIQADQDRLRVVHIKARPLAADRRTWLIFEIDVGKLLSIVIAHDEAGFLFLDGPRWRNAAGHLCSPRVFGILDEMGRMCSRFPTVLLTRRSAAVLLKSRQSGLRCITRPNAGSRRFGSARLRPSFSPCHRFAAVRYGSLRSTGRSGSRNG
jgi:hypothetical protein